MPETIGWADITLRLALALPAGAAIDFNRGERRRRDHPPGEHR